MKKIIFSVLLVFAVQGGKSAELLPAANELRFPGRVMVELPRGRLVREGDGYILHCEGAAMPEVIAALGRAFQIVIAYAGSDTRIVTGAFSGRDVDGILISLVDRSDLSVTTKRSVRTIGSITAVSVPAVRLSAFTGPTVGPEQSGEGDHAAGRTEQGGVPVVNEAQRERVTEAEAQGRATPAQGPADDGGKREEHARREP